MAITVSLVSKSPVFNGTPLPNDARVNEIRDAIAELITENRAFSSHNVRQSQDFFETLVVFTMLAKYGY